MKKNLLRLMGLFSLCLLSNTLLSQPLLPFEGCPGVSVAITRPGFNATPGPYQIYLIDDTSGAVEATGAPINLQINGFGLNNADGFLYGIHQSYNVANPHLTRVGRNGLYEMAGRIRRPEVGPFEVAIINTAAGTVDDRDNYYFTAIVINLQNILLPPVLYIGKIRNISELHEGNGYLHVDYKTVDAGTCTAEFLAAFQNPLEGIVQDIAYNPGDGMIYTYLPGTAGDGAKIARFNLQGDPTFECMEPAVPNATTAELSGLFFNPDSTLMILTSNGQLYSGNISTGVVASVVQTTLPFLGGNLRGDMASCLGLRQMAPFSSCPGLALAITRPGINSTGGAHQVYEIEPESGATRAIGSPINLQINGFGLNSRDGFLYGMHETTDIFGPTFTRVDSNGTHQDIGLIEPPPGNGNRIGIINTAAGTFDGHDKYYFIAVEADTNNITELPRLYVGIIRNVSDLEPGDDMDVQYRRVFLGSCIDELLIGFLNSSSGLFQDIAYNPNDRKIYTYIQTGASPARGKLASFNPNILFPVMECITPNQPNPQTQDLSGMHFGPNNRLYILTTDGSYYRGNPNNGRIVPIDQTDLPLLSNNLRGDMASCVRRNNSHHHDNREEPEEQNLTLRQPEYLRVAPNPITGNDISVFVNADKSTDAEVRIVDAAGNTMHARKVTLIQGDNQLRIQLPQLQRGTFALLVNMPGAAPRSAKFIRQ